MAAPDSGAETWQGAENLPDLNLSVNQVFGLETDMTVPAFSQTSEHVPPVDLFYDL